MAKYNDNKEYENDKASLIHRLGFYIEEGWNPDSDELNEILDLLKQSKWTGVDPPIINNQPVNKPCTLLKDVDTTTIPN